MNTLDAGNKLGYLYRSCISYPRRYRESQPLDVLRSDIKPNLHYVSVSAKYVWSETQVPIGHQRRDDQQRLPDHHCQRISDANALQNHKIRR